MGLKRIVLVGAGHAHLHLAAQAARFRAQGAQPVLVDPGCFEYSGLATGVLSGGYARDDGVLDPKRLVLACGGEFIRDAVTGLDREACTLQLAGGCSLPYDRVSFNIGSEVDATASGGNVDAAERAGGQARVWTVKPIVQLSKLRAALEDAFAANVPQRIVVVGGGATGVEVAANLAGLAQRLQADVQLTLVTSAPRLLPDHPAAAAASVARNLQRRRVRLVLDTRIASCQNGTLFAADGQAFAFDHAVVAVGLRARRLPAGADLPADPIDGVRVAPTLQSVADPNVFAVGDCMSFVEQPLRKLGVYGVRAAPILLHNLLASLGGRPLRRYRPQQRYLSILNLGDGTALAVWGPLWWQGRLSYLLKHRIDQRFLSQYRHAMQAEC